MESGLQEQKQVVGVEVMETTAIESQTRAEIDIAISTARRYPRSLQAFQKKAATMACLDTDVAGSCFYKLRRRGKDGTKEIEGPSIRFAEIVAASYGNLRFGARVIDIGEKWITASGIAHDLENNVQTMTEVRRRITDSMGRRYNDDMIAMTCNAACSIALRNAIFKAVPFSLAKSIYDMAKKTAIGDSKTLAERRTKMMQAFNALGISPARVYARFEIKGLEDIDLAIYEEALGIFTAIKDGDSSADTEFPELKKEAVTGTGKTITPQAQPATTEPKPNAAAGLAAAAEKNGGKK